MCVFYHCILVRVPLLTYVLRQTQLKYVYTVHKTQQNSLFNSN